MLSLLERVLLDPMVDIAKVERIEQMIERAHTRQAEFAFNTAMAAAQAEMRAVSPDKHNKQTHSDYASYAALDAMARPIYTKHGLALSFNSEESKVAEHILVLCYVTAGGFTRTYRVDMPADGKGAKGGDVMTRTHATGSAMTYGERYLLKAIFNLQVGGDDDGNAAGGVSAGDTSAITGEQVAELKNAFETLGANEAAFCTVFKIATIEELPAREFATAKARLARWAQQKGKAK
jgi:hypothetical protein